MSVPTLADIVDPARQGYHASIDGLLVRLAVGPDRPLVTETAEAQPQRFSTEANPQDMLQAFGDIHSQSDWTGGEGLLNRFRRRGTEADATRFWDSKGVDVSPSEQGRPEELRLLPTVEEVDAITGQARIAHAGETLWATAGQTLRKTTNALASSPTFADDDPHDSETATTVEDVVTLGGIPYAALGANGIHRDDGGWAHWSDVEAVRVWSVLDRIVASDGEALYEAGATDTSTLLYTLPDGDRWTEVVDAAGTMLASASNGFVYAFSLDEDLNLTVAGQTRLKDETPVAMAARADSVFVAATQGDELRLWHARIDGARLVELQLLREWNACGCGSMTASRDQVLLGVQEDDTAYIWRVELTTLGIFRAYQLPDGKVRGLATIGGKTFAGVEDAGVQRETDTLETDGYLIGPLSDFFRAEDKTWVTGWADVAIEPGESVTLWYATQRQAMFDPNHAGWRRLNTYATSASSTEIALSSRVVSRSLAMMVKLNRSPDNTSPKVRSTAFRAYPGPGDVIVQLPVDVGDQIERAGRRRLLIKGVGRKVADALRMREGQSATVRIFRTGEVVSGLVQQVATPVVALTPRGSVTQMSMVVVRGRRVAESQTIDVGDYGAWGNATFGGMSWGGQQFEEDDDG